MSTVPAGVDGPGGIRVHSDAGLESLKETKTIQLTTFRRDGTPVATPVSVAFDGERAFFRTWHTAWKAKRLAHNPEVEVAPSDLRGNPTGPPQPARARPLTGAEATTAARALSRRHRVLQGLLVPITHRLMRYRTLHYELLPRPPARRAGGNPQSWRS